MMAHELADELTACAGLAVALCERQGWYGRWADVGQGLYYLRRPACTEVTLAQVVQWAVAALEETPADETGAELVRRLVALAEQVRRRGLERQGLSGEQAIASRALIDAMRRRD